MMKTNNRIGTINGMKGWLIFVIVIYHTYNNNFGFGSMLLAPIKIYGGCFGNYIFFMLSGFLTSYSFSKTPVSKRSFLLFILKKLIRLWPLYAICNLWQLGYNVCTNGIDSFCLSNLILVILLQTGGALTDNCPYIAHGWFLCTLFVCFILDYIIRYLCKDDSGKYIWVFYLMLLWGVFLLTHSFDFPYSYVHNGEGFSSFFAGSILFEHYYYFKERKHILYLIAGICLSCFAFQPLINLGDYRLIFIFIICPCLILLSLEEFPVRAFFDLRISQWLGRISMGIYFLHTISPLSDIPFWFSNKAIGYIVYLIVIVAISYITIYLLQPLITRNPQEPKGLSYRNLVDL